MAGIRKQVIEKQELAKAAAAKKHGLPVDAFSWDDRSNSVAPNESWFAVEDKVAEIEERKVAPQLEKAKIEQAAARADFELAMKQAEKRYTAEAKADPVAAQQSYSILAERASRLYRERLEFIHSGKSSQGTAPAAPQMAQRRPQPAGPLDLTPRNSTPMSADAALALVNADPSKAGIYRLSDGRTVRVTPDK